MNWVEQLDQYLRDLERRFRLAVLLRGTAAAAAIALAATVALALITNAFAFSERSLAWSRLGLFLALAFAVAFALIVPALAINRRRSARLAEERVTAFEQRLLTLAEARRDPQEDPFLELVAADAAPVAEKAPPSEVLPSRRLLAFASAAVAAVGVLLWLILAGPGFLGYGAAMLWARHGKEAVGPFYDIVVEPGNRTVRRGGTQQITARPVGFQPSSVRLFARYRGVTKWEEAPMLPVEGSTAYAFVFAAIPETVDYYVSAGKIRSKTYTLSAADLPAVRQIRVTYRFPAWTGLPESVEDPGGDLRAVEGTEAEIAVRTDRPLSGGVLVVEDGQQIALESKGGLWSGARLKIEKDGVYHLAVREHGELVRLSDDYFIEAQKDSEPVVRIARPGRDARVSPIEEVTVSVEAGDDFGLRDLTLHYAVNGGPEQTIPLLKGKGGREAQGTAVLYLEDFRLAPGDVVAVYASARDARTSSRTDIFFLEAQPFEREFTQSQQMAGGGAMEGEQQGRISQRQKEIIAATWNQLRSPGNRQQAAENAKFLSEMQARLRDQARSLAGRMQRRQLSATNQEFQSFSEDMERAAQAMEPAAEKLKAGQWREALPHEQKALQHLLRAEATFRRIQVAFGSRGGGGGGGARDLESLFDLELDTEKNQYETGQSAASREQRDREVEEALRRLEELARRQQELAALNRQQQLTLQQRWQQELLRRETEQLQRRIEQLSRSSSQAQQTGQSSASGSARSGQSGAEARVEQTLRRLREAAESMRRAGSPQPSASSGEEARRAAERLREAAELMRGMHRQEASARLDNLARQAQELAREQREFEQRLRELYGTSGDQAGSVPSLRPGVTPEQARQGRALAQERQRMLENLQRLEQELKTAARELAGTERNAASRLRQALASIQDQEVALRMRYNAELLRRGMGSFVPPREAPITRALEEVRDQVQQAQAALEGSPERSPAGLEGAVARLERLRRRAEQLARGQVPQRGSRGEQGRRPGETGREGEQGSAGREGGTRERGGLERSPWHAGGPGEVHSAWNAGDLIPPAGGLEPRQGTLADLERWRRESLRDLAGLRQALREDPEAVQDLQALIRAMQQLDPSRFPGNPQLLGRLETQILPLLGQLEIRLRRQLEEKGSGSVRITSSEPPPPGYAEAVAEYFRRLSRGR